MKPVGDIHLRDGIGQRRFGVPKVSDDDSVGNAVVKDAIDLMASLFGKASHLAVSRMAVPAEDGIDNGGEVRDAP